MIRKNEINFKSRLEKKVTAINEWKWNTNGKKSKQSWHQRAPEDVHSMQHEFNLNRDAGIMKSLCSTRSKSHTVISHSSPFISCISSMTVTLLDQSPSQIYLFSQGLINEA